MPCPFIQAVANLSVETLERGLLTPKSNVWSFGIVLLELLTGHKNLDSRHPKEERNLVKWSRPYLADDCRLSLIMDPHLKGRFPAKAARTVADIAQRCLQMDPLERPTMRTIVEHLKIIQDMKYSCRFPLQEPAAVAGKQMSRSPSLNGIITPAPRLSFSPSPPSRTHLSVSPTRPPVVPVSLPPRACSSTLSLEDLERQESRKSSSSTSTFRRPSVEGFWLSIVCNFFIFIFFLFFSFPFCDSTQYIEDKKNVVLPPFHPSRRCNRGGCYFVDKKKKKRKKKVWASLLIGFS